MAKTQNGVIGIPDAKDKTRYTSCRYEITCNKGKSRKYGLNGGKIVQLTISVNGKVTARKAGKCTITARLSDGKTLTCKVTVSESAKLNRTQLTLKAGETFKLTVSGQKSVTWSSNNVNVATVDANGNVKAVKAGKCIITAKLSSGTSLQCKVTVK